VTVSGIFVEIKAWNRDPAKISIIIIFMEYRSITLPRIMTTVIKAI